MPLPEKVIVLFPGASENDGVVVPAASECVVPPKVTLIGELQINVGATLSPDGLIRLRVFVPETSNVP